MCVCAEAGAPRQRYGEKPWDGYSTEDRDWSSVFNLCFILEMELYIYGDGSSPRAHGGGQKIHIQGVAVTLCSVSLFCNGEVIKEVN